MSARQRMRAAWSKSRRSLPQSTVHDELRGYRTKHESALLVALFVRTSDFPQQDPCDATNKHVQ